MFLTTSGSPAMPLQDAGFTLPSLSIAHAMNFRLSRNSITKPASRGCVDSIDGQNSIMIRR